MCKACASRSSPSRNCRAPFKKLSSTFLSYGNYDLGRWHALCIRNLGRGGFQEKEGILLPKDFLSRNASVVTRIIFSGKYIFFGAFIAAHFFILGVGCTSTPSLGADGSVSIDQGEVDSDQGSIDSATDSIGDAISDVIVNDASPDLAQPNLCPGSKTFFEGDVSGIYVGKADVPSGAFNTGGQHTATLAIASICGTLRGILVVEHSNDVTSGSPSYGFVATGSAGVYQAIFTDRICGGVDCNPHYGHGGEIFDATLKVNAGQVDIAKVSIRPGVNYANIELPLTAFSGQRNFPATPYQSGGSVNGTWVVKNVASSTILPVTPVYQDTELHIESGKLIGWTLPNEENILADQLMFPSYNLFSDVRRLGINQISTGSGYLYQSVFDGNWMIGLIRETSAKGSTSNPSVPTEFTDTGLDLLGIWIGYRK